MSTLVRLAAATLLVCSLALPLEAAFSYRKLIQLDDAFVVGSTDLYQFPALITLASDADLMANVASASGFDIQFRAADGTTILDHEIERWDPATGSLTAWVRIPVLAFNAPTDIYIYYGDPGITSTLENPPGVWNSKYVGIWHLSEDPSGTIFDSSTYASNATSAGGMSAANQVPGRIAGALDFDGADDLVNAGSASVLDDLGPLTASAWVRPDGAGVSGAPKVVAKYGPAFSGRWYLELDDTAPEDNAWEFNKETSTGEVSRITSDLTATYGSWQYIVVTWTGTMLGTEVRLYRDGVELGYQLFTDGTYPPNSDAAYPFTIGNREDGTTGFDGLIDEVRLSRYVRSPEWIQTEYNNQSMPVGCGGTGFACIGSQELLPAHFIEVAGGSGLATPNSKDGGLAWGDFNNDGCLDLLVNTDTSGVGSILYLQSGGGGVCSGTFTNVTACLAPQLTVGVRERSAVWGDLDNDGYLDFARNTSSPDIEVYFNNGPGACPSGWAPFTRVILDATSIPFAFNAEGLGIIDYDADGVLDLMADQDGAIAIYASDGLRGFVHDPTTGLPTGTGGKSDYTAVTDFDVDGDVDILDRRSAGGIYVNNAGVFTANAFTESSSNGNKGGAAFCDFDDDGDFDLFWTEGGINQIWEQNPIGTFVALGLPVVTATTIDDVACGDVDNDGDLDIMLSAAGVDQLFRNDGGFTFTDITPANMGLNDGEAVAFADYDRDGDVDLAINQDIQNELWQNQTNNNNYLVVRALHDLGGTDRDALGATLRLLDCSLTPVSGIREVNGGRGHGTQDPAYVHLGLPAGAGGGPNSRYIVEVRFVGGTVVQKAVWPESLSGYQLVQIRNTDTNDVTACTTAVDLVSFDATAFDSTVVLTWETGSEANNLGFHLYRGVSPSGPFAPLTSALVPGLGSSPEGARYRYVDEGLANGTRYYYILEDIETNGRSERHGPVTATPDASLPPLATGGETASHPAVTFGEPGATRLVSTGRGPHERVVRLELITPGFDAYVRKDGTVRLDVPGFDPEGAHGLPVRRTAIETLAGARARILSVRAADVIPFDTLVPADVYDPEVVMLDSGALRLVGSGEKSRDRRLSEAARVVAEVVQGDAGKVLLELAPFRWEPLRGRLTLARRLVVDVAVTGPMPNAEAPRSKRLSSVAAELATVEPGLYGVQFEDVFPRGRAVATSALRLSRQNETVAFHVVPDPDRFGPGSTLYFVSLGERANPFGAEAVYRLERSSSGQLMPSDAFSPQSGGPAFVWKRIDLEQNRTYLPTHLEAEDPWIWDSVFQGVRRGYEADVSGVANGYGPARLTAWLLGGTDFPTSPDHHVRLWLNGTLVGETSWNAKRPRIIEASVPDGTLREGTNWIEVENVGDTGARYSLVFLDRFRLEYPGRLVAEEGRFEATFSRSGNVAIEGLGLNPLVVDVSEATPRWQPIKDGLFTAVAGRHYLAASTEGMRRPRVRFPAPTTLGNTSNHAEYLVIGSETFLEAATPLLEHRRAQGLDVTSIPLEAIYSEFGFGEKTPEAIREFLRYASHDWSPPAPRYVLLLGDGSYDFENFLGAGPDHQRFPPYSIETRFMRTASDPSYVAVKGDDGLPDLAIGRIPAASVSALERAVAKILAYEASGAHSHEVVLVADNSDLAGDFEADVRELASTVLAGTPVEELYLRQLGVEATRQRIIDGFDRGVSIMSYVGHGGIDLWADEVLFRSSSVSDLSPRSELPIVLTMNCLNGYFHFPFQDSLAEALVTAEGRGAIAAFSPSGFSLHAPAHQFHQALLRELVSGRHERLGDAVFAAQSSFVSNGGDPEMVRIYHLFGDPALVLQR